MATLANFKQKAIAVATSKVTNVNRADKQPGKAHMTFADHVKATVDACADFLSSNTTMQNSMALWQSAREAVKAEVRQAAKDIAPGKDWDKYMAQVRVGMVNAKLCRNKEAAGQVLRDILKAVGLTGRGKNGVRKGAPKKTKAKQKTVAPQEVQKWLTNVVGYVARMQRKYSGDALLDWGIVAYLAQGESLKAAQAAIKAERKTAKAKRSKADKVGNVERMDADDAADILDELNS